VKFTVGTFSSAGSLSLTMTSTRVKPRQAAERISTVSGSSPSPVGMTVGALGVGAPSTGSGSSDSRSTVEPTCSRTRHRVPRARISAPSGSSPRVDRCSTSPSGNRRVRIGVVGIHAAYLGADGGKSRVPSAGSTYAMGTGLPAIRVTRQSSPLRRTFSPITGKSRRVKSYSKSPFG
jgi:hypothetical protein